MVEDEARFRELVSDVLEEHGWAVRAVGSAEAGLEALLEEPVDVLLTDFELPRHNGGWLVREARARGVAPRGGAVLVTATVGVERPEGVPLLQKPVDLGELLQTLGRCAWRARGAQARHAE